MNCICSDLFQWSGVTVSHPDVISWTDLLDLGQAEADDLLVDRHRRMAINQCAMIVYTSGTTGNPKGSFLSYKSVHIFKNVSTSLEMLKNESPLMSVVP